MFGLTPLGVFHTAISQMAVPAGPIALVRYKQIPPKNLVGKVYVVTTIVTCVTAFGIFQHGGVGKPHALGIVTLVVLGVGPAAGYSNLFGPGSACVETVIAATLQVRWLCAQRPQQA